MKPERQFASHASSAPGAAQEPEEVSFAPGKAADPAVAPLAVLWRRKYWILSGLLLGACLGAGKSILQEPAYESAALLEIRGFNEKFMGLSQVDPQAGTDSYGATASNIQTQVRIMTSSSMRGRVVERLSLELTPVGPAAAGVFGRLRNRLGLSTREPVEAMREALITAARTAEARPVGSSRLVQIKARSPSPEVAASFVNTLASEYASQTIQARSANAIRTIQWIEGQLEETRGRLDGAEANLHEFLGRSGLDFVAESGTLDRSKLAKLQADLSAIQTERIDKQARWELAQSSPVDSLPEILDDGRLRDLQRQLTQLREERAQLLATLMPGHVTVRRLDSRIAEIGSTLEREKANLVRRIRNEFEAAADREQMLAEAYRRQAGQIAGKSGSAAQYGALVREVDTAQAVYGMLTEQLNTAYMAAAVPAESVRIVEEATRAPEPSEPNPVRDIALGSLLTGGLVFGLFFLAGLKRQKRLSKVFAGPGYVNGALQLPELGVIPSLDAARRAPLLSAGRAEKRSSRFGMAGRRQPPVQPELVTWRHQPSLLAESFRLTLTSIMGSRGWAWKPVIVLTSPGPSEGKTTVVSNLAIAMAQAGRRVVLVDADWRKASLHKAFTVPRQPGIVDWLQDDGPSKTPDLEACLHETEIPGLSLMPGGQAAGDQAGQLAFSARLVDLIAELRERFDAVLIDTAPGLHFADARQLGRLTDGVILVVRAGATYRESAVRLHDQFLADGIPVLGAVLNDWSPSEDDDEVYSKQYMAYQRTYESAG